MPLQLFWEPCTICNINVAVLHKRLVGGTDIVPSLLVELKSPATVYVHKSGQIVSDLVNAKFKHVDAPNS